MPRGAWIQTRRAGPGVRVSGAYGMHRIASDAPPSSAHIHRLRAAGGVIANVVRRPAHKREEVRCVESGAPHTHTRAVLAFAFCRRSHSPPSTTTQQAPRTTMAQAAQQEPGPAEAPAPPTPTSPLFLLLPDLALTSSRATAPGTPASASPSRAAGPSSAWRGRSSSRSDWSGPRACHCLSLE